MKSLSPSVIFLTTRSEQVLFQDPGKKLTFLLCLKRVICLSCQIGESDQAVRAVHSCNSWLSLLLDNRLRKWAEDNKVLPDFQFGFRKNKSTVDCIFVLSSIISKLVNCDKRKLYCAFVDFRKAFDLVYRNGIWHKLISNGVSSKMVHMLKAIYESVNSCVRVNGKLSDHFDTYMGVKQGEPLSPLLFIVFINDMSATLENDGIDSISIDELQIFLVLFADDTAIIFKFAGRFADLIK